MGKGPGNPNRRRGFDVEREIVREAKDRGLESERARGSNGKALGEAQEVDCLVAGWRVSAKRRKRLPEYLQFMDGVDAIVFRQDRGEKMALLPYAKLLELIADSDKSDTPGGRPSSAAPDPPQY